MAMKMTEELPNEITISIFLKLPVKSLVRFRCVSKSISASVRSPNFIATHHSIQKQNRDPQILLKLRRSNYTIDKPYFTTLSAEFRPYQNIRIPLFEDFISYTDVDGPCNGVFCLTDNDRIALWNPWIREFKQVPPSTILRPPETEVTHTGPVAFGFDSRSGDYKVFRTLTNYFSGGMSWSDQAEIYCLNSNAWREISAPENLIHSNPKFGDFENGLYHYGGVSSDGRVIISFDLTNESLTLTVIPLLYDYLFDFVEHPDGHMAFIAHNKEMVYELWVNKDGWIKEWSMNFFPGVKRTLGFWRHLFLESNDGEVLVLDLQSGKTKNFGLSAFPGQMQVILYSESLVPINGGTEQQESIVREMIHH